MIYCSCPDVVAPELALDDPALIEAAAAVERGEQDLCMLSRLAKIAMALAETVAAYATARLTAAAGETGPLGPREDPTAPFDRIAQTVRRIIAMRAALAESVGGQRSRLLAERVGRHARRDAGHSRAKRSAVEAGFNQALAEDYPRGDEEPAERLLEDMAELLDTDERFSDFLDRPVGETIARLCGILGLDPALCIRDGDGWKVRREPFAFGNDPIPPWPASTGTGCEAPRAGSHPSLRCGDG